MYDDSKKIWIGWPPKEGPQNFKGKEKSPPPRPGRFMPGIEGVGSYYLAEWTEGVLKWVNQ